MAEKTVNFVFFMIPVFSASECIPKCLILNSMRLSVLPAILLNEPWLILVKSFLRKNAQTYLALTCFFNKFLR